MCGNLAKHAAKVLVIGGGIGGSATAIRMAEHGVKVELVDIAQDWGVAGTGVTLSVLTARALCDLGFAQLLIENGHLHDKLEMFTPDGTKFNEVTGKRHFAPDVPREGGVMRPQLHRMMAARMAALGVSVRTGLTATSLAQDGGGVDAVFSDGTTGRYDLAIGADGLFSSVRGMIMPDAPKPRYTGQVCWRAQFALPEGWENGRMYFGPLKIGFTPCAPDAMYLFVLENVTEKPRYEPDELLPRLRDMLTPYPALDGLREGMDESTPILARPLETILLEDPWYVGRVILIGDAAHATTPHLASGAGMAVEDAIVLVDELDRAGDYDSAMRAFMARRLPRGKMVVGNSLKLGEMEQRGAPPSEIGPLMMQSLAAIEQPY